MTFLFKVFSLCFLLTASMEAKQKIIPKKSLAVCAIFQNEGRFLKEWIEYHHLVGVEHFFLYNNKSSDDFRTVLEPYIQSGLVELIDWDKNNFNLSSYAITQALAYRNGLRRARGEYRWLALIDIDEFIVPIKRDNLLEVLEDYQKFGGLCINWQLFGTSFVPEIPADRLMIELLSLKAPQNFPRNYVIKSIVQPLCVSRCTNPHFCEYREGYFHVDTSKKGFYGAKSPVVLTNVIQLNHYYLRDLKFLFEVKIPRYQRWGWKKDLEKLDANRLNTVKDQVIQRFVPKLQKKMDKKI